MASRNKVALVGAGRMGSAMAAGWLGAKDNALPPEDLILVCPRVSDSARPLVDRYGLKVVETLDAKTAAEVGRVVVAVKPQVFPKIAPALSEVVREDALIISVLAGTGLTALGRVFPGRPVIRVMPNTPGSIGKGINVAVANAAGDTPENRKAAEDLAGVTGPVEWLDEERLMDAATGVSGSGPAYVFLFCEALAKAGEAEGLPADLAERLAVATVTGAGALLEDGLKNGTADAAALRKAVTSPKGTTQAALDVLMAPGALPALVRNAVAAAERRSRELGADTD